MSSAIATAIVLLTGAYLLGFATVATVAPERARGFLGGFARTRAAHFTELLVRLLVGAAFVFAASNVAFPGIFEIFGWIVLVTTVLLFLVPWRFHQRFASWSVPLATRRLGLLAAGSMLAGAFVILAVLKGAP